jgi:hypothetical protein
MPSCRICAIDKEDEEFEMADSCRRKVCRECRTVQRRQWRVMNSSSNGDNASIASESIMGGASEGAEAESVASHVRRLEGQLRALTEEHRRWGIVNGERMVQLEQEVQSLRARGVEACTSTALDPLWRLWTVLMCTTLVFVLMRWWEGRLMAKMQAHPARESRRGALS